MNNKCKECIFPGWGIYIIKSYRYNEIGQHMIHKNGLLTRLWTCVPCLGKPWNEQLPIRRAENCLLELGLSRWTVQAQIADTDTKKLQWADSSSLTHPQQCCGGVVWLGHQLQAEMEWFSWPATTAVDNYSNWQLYLLLSAARQGAGMRRTRELHIVFPSPIVYGLFVCTFICMHNKAHVHLKQNCLVCGERNNRTDYKCFSSHFGAPSHQIAKWAQDHQNPWR